MSETTVIDSQDSQQSQDSQEFLTETVYVLVIYTGGTIGMKESPDGKCVS